MVLSDSLVLPPIKTTVGGVLLGLCLSLLFYGILLCQGRWYFKTYQEDPMDLKLTVAAILLANAVGLGLVMHTCYYYIVMDDLTPDMFYHITITLALIPISIFFSIGISAYVYIRRAYLTQMDVRHKFIVVTYASAAAFIAVLTAQMVIQPTFEQWLKYKWLVSAAFGCAMVYDLGVACVLCLTLHVNRTGLRRMDAILNSIITNAFTSGIVTSMLSISCLLVAVFEGRNLFIIPLSLVAAKVYASATLVTLNVRREMSEKLKAPPESDFMFRGMGTQSHRTQQRLNVRESGGVTELDQGTVGLALGAGGGSVSGLGQQVTAGFNDGLVC